MEKWKIQELLLKRSSKRDYKMPEISKNRNRDSKVNNAIILVIIEQRKKIEHQRKL